MSKPVLAAMLSCKGSQLSDEEKYLFAAYNPLGISLFTRNLQDKGQVKTLVSEIKDVINRDDVLIAVDQEGGRVSRLDTVSLNRFASEEALGALPAEYSKCHAQLIAVNLHELGINLNYAPVVDRKTIPQNKVLESRCFSTADEQIVNLGKTMAETYIEMAICPCIKHFPGHLNVLNDPHLSSLKSDMKRLEIEKNISYLLHFKDFPMAMTSHIILSDIDSQSPATQSKKIIEEIIRSYLEFDGFLLSDSIDMHALQGNIAERAVKSLDAGVDAVCCCSGRYADLEAVCAQKRFLTEKSLIRFAKIKKVIHNTPKYIAVEDIRKRYDEGLKEKLNAEYSYDATEVLHQMLKKGEN